MRIEYLYLFLIAITSYGCVDSDYFEIEADVPETQIAFPIAYAQATVVDIAEQNSDQVTVQIDEEGQVTILYRGDFLSQTANELFPPLPLFSDFRVWDNPDAVQLPLIDNLNISKAIFRLSNIRFKIKEQDNVDQVHFHLPDFSKNGETFKRIFVIEELSLNNGLLESSVSSLDGWEIQTVDNQILAEYDAFDADGNKISLEEAYLNIDFIAFSYVEGDLGERIFDLEGTNISIGIFKNWISGGFSFDDPKIILDIENSFGLPMNAIFNKMELVTKSGNVLPIESDIIDQGLSFNYPSLDEVGEVKLSQIVFDSSNSNLEEIFNEKAIAVNFDIDAFANPPGAEIETGFLTNESYYNVEAVVELPLHTRIDDLVLGDTVDIDLIDLDEIVPSKLILSIQNGLPIEVEIKTYFIKDDAEGIDLLNQNEWMKIESANNPDGQISDQEIQKLEYDIMASEWEGIRQSDRLAFLLKLNTPENSNEYFWILGHQGLDIQLSAIASYH